MAGFDNRACTSRVDAGFHTSGRCNTHTSSRPFCPVIVVQKSSSSSIAILKTLAHHLIWIMHSMILNIHRMEENLRIHSSGSIGTAIFSNCSCPKAMFCNSAAEPDKDLFKLQIQGKIQAKLEEKR